ncbi:MAG: DoxX family protein [Candidatus Paceibacterota bacterium]
MNEINLVSETLEVKMKRFAPIVVRLGLAVVFLWFGTQQIINTSAWVNLIPSWITSISGISAVGFVHFNGAFEIVFGLCLLMGYFTKATAFLLALHMLHITFTVGYNGIGVRDFGLSMATISIFLYGIDSWCLDKFLVKK